MLGNPDSPRMPKMLPILKTLFTQATASPKLQAWFIPAKVAMGKFLLLEEFGVETLSTLILNWNRGFQIAKISYKLIIWNHLDIWTHFSPKKLTWVLSSTSQSSVFYFWWIILRKREAVTFHTFSEFLRDQNWQKVRLVFNLLGNQSHISSALLLLFFVQRVNQYLFIWSRLSF